jgi:prepilin-type N-terminal cleavage/methylation domain-containing protein
MESMVPTRSKTNASMGFTLVELMVVVVIISILAVISAPVLTRDRDEDRVRTFANALAMDFQRTKFQVVSTRLPMHIYLYSDRVEFRESTGVDGGAAPALPTLATPPQRVLRAENGVSIRFVTGTRTPIPTAGGPTTAPPAFEMQVDGLGRTRRIVSGAPVEAMTYIWIETSRLSAAHPSRRFRLDVSPLTGIVQLKTNWTSL